MGTSLRGRALAATRAFIDSRASLTFPAHSSSINSRKRKSTASAITTTTMEDAQEDSSNIQDMHVRNGRHKHKKLSKEAIAALVPFTSPPPQNMYIGAHMSATGGVSQAVYHAVAFGARSFAFFTRSRARWECPPLSDEEAAHFRDALATMGYTPQHVVPHASYLINAGCPIPENLMKSREGMLDEVHRCEKLGLCFYNFHPGSSLGLMSADECIQTIAETINIVHSKTSGVCLLLENTASLTNGIGAKFEQLAEIIAHVDDKSRIGVCLDTCHAFAAGYDISTRAAYEDTMATFDKVVGLQYLKAMHINDSKTPLGSGRDRHERLGHGKIGLKAFEFIVNDTRLKHIPLILETPSAPDGRGDHEVEMLYSFIKPKP